MLNDVATGDVEVGEAQGGECACGFPLRSEDGECSTNRVQGYNLPGLKDGRLWWEQSSAYWELPFFAEYGYSVLSFKDRDCELAAREQLFAVREGLA